MKVYLVWEETYSTYSYDGTEEVLLGVFSTKEKAIMYMKTIAKSSLTEVTLDQENT
jgi:hypothetical protein